MPEKTSKDGRRYEIDGRRFTWFPLDEDDKEGDGFTIPLRIKVSALRGVADQNLDASGMFAFLERILPENAMARVDEMDVNDFQEMFATWQKEYNSLTGASLGESSGSSS